MIYLIACQLDKLKTQVISAYALILHDLNQTEDLEKLIGKMTNEEKKECALAFAQRGDAVNAKKFADLADKRKFGAYWDVLSPLLSADAVNAEEFANLSGYEGADIYKDCALAFAQRGDEVNAKKFADRAGPLKDSAYSLIRWRLP